jgi:hypothetical protein
MQSSLRAAAISLIAALLLPANGFAQPQEPIEAPPPNPFVAGFDVVILRPLGLVATAVGAVLFVPVALLTAPSGKDGLQSALETLVIVPGRSVFQRPLGEL